MAFSRITSEDTKDKGVTGLPAVPALEATAMQKKFDELSTDVLIPKFNDLVERLEGVSASADIGVDMPEDVKEELGVDAAQSLQNFLLWLYKKTKKVTVNYTLDVIEDEEGKKIVALKGTDDTVSSVYPVGIDAIKVCNGDESESYHAGSGLFESLIFMHDENIGISVSVEGAQAKITVSSNIQALTYEETKEQLKNPGTAQNPGYPNVNAISDFIKEGDTRHVSYSEITEGYADYESRLLQCACGFIFTDKTDTTKLCVSVPADGISATISGVDLYVAQTEDKIASDYVYHNGEKFVLVRQISSDAFSGAVQESDISIDMALIDKIILPFPISEMVKIFDGESDAIVSISYKDCCGYLDGIRDDRPAVKCAHRIANNYGLKVKNSAGDILIANSGYIEVESDVDLNGSTIEITNYNRNGTFWLNAISWEVESDGYKNLTPSSTACEDWGDGAYPVNTVFKITRKDVCQRYETDDAQPESITRQDMVLMTFNGNIIYPPIDSFSENEDMSCTAYIYPEKRIRFTGCKIKVNKTWSGSALYFMRVERSNVEIKDFTIIPSGSTTKNTSYNGSIFVVNNAFDVTFDHITGFNIAGHATASMPNGAAGYVFDASAALKLTIKNCIIGGFWGCMGMKNCKDVSILDSTLNRIDIHDYFRDLKISGCTILNEAVQIGYGTGAVLIENTVLYTSKDYFVQLRTDYGREFCGSIMLYNCHVKPTGALEQFAVVSNDSNFVMTAILKSGISLSGIAYLTEPVVVCNVMISGLGDADCDPEVIRLRKPQRDGDGIPDLFYETPEIKGVKST